MLQEELHAKDLEIFKLTARIDTLEQKPKQIRLLKDRVEQLEKDFQLEIESVIKNTRMKNSSSNPKYNSTLPFGDSFSESSEQSRSTFNIQRL